MTLKGLLTFVRSMYFQRAPVNWKKAKWESSYCDSQVKLSQQIILWFLPCKLFKPRGQIHFCQATNAIRAIWKICDDSGLTGLILPLLIIYIVSKSHKGTYKFNNENSFFQGVLLEAESEPLLLLHWFKKLNFILPNRYFCTFPSIEKYFPIIFLFFLFV